MNNNDICIELVDSKYEPQRKIGDAGFDLKAEIEDPIKLTNIPVKIPTGVKFEFAYDQWGMIVPRSGSGSKGLGIANTIGTIDSDYRGILIVKAYHKFYDELDDIWIEPGERFAQIVILPRYLGELQPVDDIADTERGGSGFGDSGRF